MVGRSLLAATLVAFAAPGAHGDLVVYSGGHADVGVGYAGGFDLHVHGHAGAVFNGVPLGADAEFDPGDVLIVVPPSTYQARSPGAVWNFIGVAAGEYFWRLPFSGMTAAAQNAPHLGIGAEEIGLGVFVGDQLTFALTGVASAPVGGQFSLFLDDGTRLMDTFDGNFANDSFVIPVSLHDHFNWGFTRPGRYDLEFTVSGTHGVDGFVAGTAIYSFFVYPVPEPSSALLVSVAGLSSAVLAFGRRRSAKAPSAQVGN